jgi:two-component system, OmpR family, KDP operon response regulator KdpE
MVIIRCMHSMKGRILLGDDDVVLQRAVSRIAATRGYEVFSARTGPEVLTMASALQPELIVLDISFPDADGRDLLRQLKEAPHTAQIPVLVWSATENDSNRRIALNLGAEDFVQKGTALALLPRIARILLRLRQNQDLTGLADDEQTPSPFRPPPARP